MVGKPQTLSEGQKKEVSRFLWNKVLTVSLIVLALLTGITGLSLWGIKCRLEQKLETLVAQQFEEPRIQTVVSNVAETKAVVLLTEQILPEVEKFKREINKQLEEIRSAVATIETLKSRSDSNSEQIEKVLSSARSSQGEIEKFKNTISGLQSDLVKINRGLVEIQYFTLKGSNKIPNPYGERINKVFNEIITIAVPNPQERSKFVQELNTYQWKKE